MRGFAIVLTFLALSAIGAVIAYRWNYTERVYPGAVDAQGLQLGELTRQEASNALVARYRPFLERKLRLRYDDREWLVGAEEDGFKSTIVRTVTEPGKEPRALRLVSTYKPSRNVVRVGPPREAAPQPAKPPTPNPVVPGQKPGETNSPPLTPAGA